MYIVSHHPSIIWVKKSSKLISSPLKFKSTISFIVYYKTRMKEKWIETPYLIILYGTLKSARYCSAFLFHACNMVNKIKHLADHFVFINYNISKELITKERKEKINKKISHLILICSVLLFQLYHLCQIMNPVHVGHGNQ